MQIQRGWFEELIFRGAAARRFTQDSPVLPDVWIRYAETYPVDAGPTDLILTPHRATSTGELAQAIRSRLKQARGEPSTTPSKKKAPAKKPSKPSAPSIRDARIAHHMTGVCALLTFEELIRVVMPLSPWWDETFCGATSGLTTPAARTRLIAELGRLSPDAPDKDVSRKPSEQIEITPELLWTIRIVGSILLARKSKESSSQEAFTRLVANHAGLVDEFLRVLKLVVPHDDSPMLWTVSRNRRVSLAIARSRQAVKVDAAQRVFEINTNNLAWAVLDTGIDATHPAFRPSEEQRRRKPRPNEFESRVVATFDFSNVRALLNPDEHEAAAAASDASDDGDAEVSAKELRRRLQTGRSIDWDQLRPFLTVKHDPKTYPIPLSEHGTHVAGILAGNWPREESPAPGKAGAHAEVQPPESLIGICPQLKLYDFRVFDAQGEGDEFMVMAALQFIRHLNAEREEPLIHGANLSVSLPHDVANYACGRTPVCEECERVVSSGVVVVAAAGNEGYMRFITPKGDAEGYRSISISDPGNAESVITVGATHRFQPHTYGVSYFSSRGPTGDGRQKPDLVAPGEKITAPIPRGSWARKDGTSMAAPHVSGAAALLMARHRELIGRPQRVKEILCATATDLGRERYFQGAGMIDVLRAIQAV